MDRYLSKLTAGARPQATTPVPSVVVPGNGSSGNGNGRDPELRALEAELRALTTSVLLARSQFARDVGLTFNGAREMWRVLGYSDTLTTKDYRERYTRGGIAGRIVDVMPDATWRGEPAFEIIEDENPEASTAFEQAWEKLDRKHQIAAKLQRVDKLARLSTYAVLLIGAPGDLESPLPKVTSPDRLLYLMPFQGGGGPSTGNSAAVRTVAADADCTVHEYETDAKNPRFGLPRSYKLKRTDVSSPELQKPVHWTRIIHIAEGLLDDEVFGQPALERVWNLLDDLDKVTGGGAEAFWLRANQGVHMDVDKDMQLSDPKNTFDALKEQVEAYKHNLDRWIRTKGVSIQTLGSDVANFSNPADAIITQIAGAKGIPKRILTGSEMGELASSQDRENFKDLVNGRQTQYAAPYIIRPLVDRLIAYGYLPAPKKGPDQYQVKWPHIQTLTEQERSTGATQWASTNATMKNAGLEPAFTGSEIRDKWYSMPPLSEEQKKEIADARAQAVAQAQAAMAAKTSPEAEKNALQGPDDASTNDNADENAKGRKAFEAASEELLEVLQEAIECNNTEVIDHILGISHSESVRVPGSGNFGHSGRPGERGGSSGEAGSGEA